MPTLPTYIILGFIFFTLFVLVTCVRIVPQAQIFVIERLGSYLRSWNTGVHFLVPMIDRVANRVSLKEKVLDFPPQPVITKDNVTMNIDTVVFCQVTDAKLYTYGVEQPINAIDKLTATTLRNIIGSLKLDDTLASRDQINQRITMVLDEATDKWGIKVNRVELKNLQPPHNVLEDMQKLVYADRERRKIETLAEARRMKIETLAEARRRKQVLLAEGEKSAKILRAEGESEAIRMLNEAAPNDKVLVLKSFEAFIRAADGKSNKLIIPSQIQSIASMTATVSEILKSTDNTDSNSSDTSKNS
ncbi:MAG: SPFH/Band 7/PHB domain protein [Thermoguttaceae bacterium]|nr:SPFH/Band 7/PHB domain protein [Thermoguttaceae bacterium]